MNTKDASKNYIQEFSMPITKNTPNFSNYTYNCVDQSILLEPFKKYYLRYWHQLIPDFATANVITIVASALMWLSFLFVCFYAESFAIGTAAIFCALCVHLYVVGDNVDGMRAKASGTSSPLGEFLDHYLDSYNISLSVIISAYLFHVEENYLVFPVILMMMLSFVFTMADQKITGLLFFGRINSLEMSTALTISYLLLGIPAYANLWPAELVGNVKAYVLLVLISIMLQLPVISAAAKRMKKVPFDLRVFVISFCGLLLLMLFDIERMVGWAILTFYGAEYVGRIILSHVGEMHFPRPRYASIVVMIVYAGLRFTPGFEDYQSTFALFVALYFVLTALIVFTHSFWMMRSFWIWKNPPLSKG